ncbi:recombinase family protein [Oscillospiraceae bacterium OttesenSCG-928-G22]|nr:recombinase family protein [Oscillospiraceae bacterium OttesenSCG-928-G22]
MNLQATYSVGIYARLSKDDERAGESMSIENQRSILRDYVSQQPGWVLHDEYIDDGISGATMERPGFQRMIQDARDGVINLLLCKDMSRFGRNYIEVGQYTDYILPMLGCRLVAPGDNVDTLREENDILPYRNLFNEFLCRDTSKKVRAVYRMNAENGKFTGSYAPYGLQKDPADRHRLTPDPVAAVVVRRVFEMRAGGMGYNAIAAVLNDEGLPSPRAYWYQSQGREHGAAGNGLWDNSQIMRLLKNEVYIGHMVAGKQSSISFKNHKQIAKPKDEWIRVENTHEPLISLELWERVQALNAKRHRPKKTAEGESNLLTGLLKCADCGYSMRLQNHKTHHKDGSVLVVKKFMCSNYARSGKNACAAHVIKQEVIERFLLEDIRENARLVMMDERRVIDAIVRMRNTDSVSRLAAYRQELRHGKNRAAELERLISSLYEDRIKGTIPESVFQTLMDKYEQERLAKTEHVAQLERRIAEQERGWGDASQWTSLIKSYINLETLDAATLLELVDHIAVHEAKIIDGQRVMELKVRYRFMENVDMEALKREVRYGQAV